MFETKAWAAVIALVFIVSKLFEQIQSDILERAMVIEWEIREGREKQELVQMFGFSSVMSHSDDAEQHWTLQQFCSMPLDCDLDFRHYH